MSNSMNSRDKCSACGGAEKGSLYHGTYTEDAIRHYLVRFYESQGGIECEHLSIAHYELVERGSCGLVYQMEVLGDEEILKLYEHWINLELAFQRHLNDVGIPLYSKYAQEVMQIVTYFPSAEFRVKWTFRFRHGVEPLLFSIEHLQRHCVPFWVPAKSGMSHPSSILGNIHRLIVGSRWHDRIRGRSGDRKAPLYLMTRPTTVQQERVNCILTLPNRWQ